MKALVFANVPAKLLRRMQGLVVACVASMAIAASPAEAGIITYGSISVSGTGLDYEGGFDPSRVSRSEDFESESSLHASDSLLSYQHEIARYPRNEFGLAPYESSAGIRSANGNLGLFAEGGRFGSAAASVFWADSIQLVPPSGGDATSIAKLDFWFDLHGILATTANDGGSSRAEVIADLNGNRVQESVQSVSIQIGETDDHTSESDSMVINRMVLSSIDLTDGAANILYGMQVEAASVRGSAISNFFATLSLAAITFEDGSTPESQGYTLAFASGMQSPNVNAVPEPSSLVLLATGSLIGAVQLRRRAQSRCRGRGR